MAQIFLILTFIFCFGAIGGLFNPEQLLEKVVKEPKKRTRGMAFTLYSVMAFISFITAGALSGAGKQQPTDNVSNAVQPVMTEQPVETTAPKPAEVTTVTSAPKTNWSTYLPSFEHGLKKTICAISRCGGFSFTQVGDGKVNDNEAAIFKVHYVEIRPGSSGKKLKMCSYLLAVYDKDFKGVEDLQVSRSIEDSNCSMNHEIYAGNETTFQQMLRKKNYIGSGPK